MTQQAQKLKKVVEYYEANVQTGVRSYIPKPANILLDDLLDLQSKELVRMHCQDGLCADEDPWRWMPTDKGFEWYKKQERGLDPEAPDDVYHLTFEMTKQQYQAFMQIVQSLSGKADFAMYMEACMRMGCAAYAPEYINAMKGVGHKCVIRVLTPEEAVDAFTDSH